MVAEAWLDAQTSISTGAKLKDEARLDPRPFFVQQVSHFRSFWRLVFSLGEHEDLWIPRWLKIPVLRHYPSPRRTAAVRASWLFGGQIAKKHVSLRHDFRA